MTDKQPSDKHELLEWEALYQTRPAEEIPWFYESLDQDFVEALKKLDITHGHILDIGAGLGTQAIALAQMGFTVTATDISATAVAKAKQKSQEQQCQIDFIQDDILNSQLQQTFRVVLDRGCFHAILPPQRDSYRENVCRLLEPNGYLLLKCFSYLAPKTEGIGPYRFAPAELEAFFSPFLKIHSITASIFYGPRHEYPALLSVMEKR